MLAKLVSPQLADRMIDQQHLHCLDTVVINPHSIRRVGMRIAFDALISRFHFGEPVVLSRTRRDTTAWVNRTINMSETRSLLRRCLWLRRVGRGGDNFISTCQGRIIHTVGQVPDGPARCLYQVARALFFQRLISSYSSTAS